MPVAKDKFGTWSVADGEAVQGTAWRRRSNRDLGRWCPEGGRRPIGRLTPASCWRREPGRRRHEGLARALQVGTATVERVRRRCVEEGLEVALGRRQQLNRLA